MIGRTLMEIRLFMRLLANLTISFNQGLMFHHGEINHLPTIVVFLVTTKRRGYYVVCGGNGMKEVTILFSSGAQIQFNAVEFSVSKNPVGGFKGFSWTDSALGPQIARIKPENVDNVVIEDFVYDRKNYPKVEKQSDWKRFVAGVNWKS